MVCPPSSSPGDCAISSLQLALHPLAKNWWAVTDSNRRHSACKADSARLALPDNDARATQRKARIWLTLLMVLGVTVCHCPPEFDMVLLLPERYPGERQWQGSPSRMSRRSARLEDRREIPDDYMRGLYLIVQPTGAKSWAVRYRHGGKSAKHRIGPYPAFGSEAGAGRCGGSSQGCGRRPQSEAEAGGQRCRRGRAVP